MSDLQIPGVSVHKDIETLTAEEFDVLITAFQHIMYDLAPTNTRPYTSRLKPSALFSLTQIRFPFSTLPLTLESRV